eukprot:2831766-Pleurochrysis_carterae.AAC.1
MPRLPPLVRPVGLRMPVRLRVPLRLLVLPLMGQSCERAQSRRRVARPRSRSKRRSLAEAMWTTMTLRRRQRRAKTQALSRRQRT